LLKIIDATDAVEFGWCTIANVAIGARIKASWQWNGQDVNVAIGAKLYACWQGKCGLQGVVYQCPKHDSPRRFPSPPESERNDR
jgi:hypothetical protein